MSMQSWTVEGFGFVLGTGGHSFVLKHRDTVQKLNGSSEFLKMAEEFDNEEDFFNEASLADDLYIGDNGGEGIGALVADVMSEETGITFTFCPADGDTGSEDTIMLEKCMPWQFTEKEKNLTRGGLIKICKPYMEELGLEGEAEFVSVEYYG